MNHICGLSIPKPRQREPLMTLAPPPLEIFYPKTLRGARKLVSATRVFSALRHHLGCVPTGERGPGGEYWMTPKLVRFPVQDPMPSRDSASVHTVTGRSLSYTYDYAYALLAHASWLVAHAVPEDRLRAPSDAALQILDVAAPAPPLRDLSETIFV